MTNIRKLINQIANAEAELFTSEFLAPCVKGGRVRTKVAGMVYTFTPKPSKFEGWGIFQPVDTKTAKVIEEADLPQIGEYLQHFPQIRLRLAYQLQGKTWLAYPVNEVDVRQRSQVVKPIAVHLVTEAGVFEQIIARWNGQSCWFEDIDRRTDPIIVETLQSAVKRLIPVEELQFKDLTPEIRIVYELATKRIEGFDQAKQDEKRLKKALQMGGGDLNQFHDRGDYWTVDWTTADRVRHSSAIAKTDLTVISSGICLSGRDRDFDLQSLVAVIEQREY
ncbi:hypothetical protein [Aulosira sp. FACHB-615]|uniref:hypothetical protein n=1 Tax=Aulosira sp. FACHB-615 TaxID=2692777 RepID=UPI001687B0B0|nr:hypothetical protein [Aulosira sp. FACHB-615]MBD2488152.1 hypothetical protein [Aulosira sp. FACHB-615]